MSVPGRDATQKGRGQKLLIVGNTGTTLPAATCCAVRDVMKYLSHVLGLRNEYQRIDRDIIVTGGLIHPTLQRFNMYNVFQPSSKVINYPETPAFDSYSITMMPQNQYANATTDSIYQFSGATLTAGITAPGDKPLLSLYDCKAIAYKYGCGGTCANRKCLFSYPC